MKFQKRSMQSLKVMLCNKKRDVRKDGRTEGRTKQMQYAPPTSKKLGHKNSSKVSLFLLY